MKASKHCQALPTLTAGQVDFILRVSNRLVGKLFDGGALVGYRISQPAPDGTDHPDHGDRADWWFRRLADVYGPTWELVRLEKGNGATLSLVCSLGDHAHPPLCTCGPFQQAHSCDHLAALHALATQGKIV